MNLLLRAAKQAISAKWGTEQPLDQIDWVHRTWELLGMEKITVSLEHYHTLFDKKWGPSIHFLSHEFRELSCPRYLSTLRLTSGVARHTTLTAP